MVFKKEGDQSFIIWILLLLTFFIVSKRQILSNIIQQSDYKNISNETLRDLQCKFSKEVATILTLPRLKHLKKPF